ncbi:hypothetical protein [Actinomycetospora sp. CA-084318]|uniref:hypothetical protein n=1 Tax=Actinomycetospora sp. CA-084318 TaxID=3239892 RepID=UPI003D9938B6
MSLEAGAAAETAQLLALETRALGEGADILASAVVAPALEAALVTEDPAVGLGFVDDVFRAFAGSPISGNLEEFDAWLADADAVLVLDPNAVPSAICRLSPD